MLTPQEVSEHGFSKASFGGYNMAMVDEFLDQLTEDYTALYKENASLKAKMKVLADSLEEYRATEKGMRRALLAAQQAADEMVKEAESRKSELMRDAEADAKAQIAQLHRQVNDEQARLSAAQAATAEFVAQIREACRKQEACLDGLNTITAPAVSAPSVEQTAQDIEQSVQRLIEQEEEETQDAPQGGGEPPQEEGGEGPSLYEEVAGRSHRDQERERAFQEAPQEEDMDSTSPTRRIDFDNLQFGANYDLK
jgi:cell division initiation protein